MRNDLITEDDIRLYLRTHTFGQKIHAFFRIGSTNEFANKLAEFGEQEGTLIIAEQQTKGRGRLKREWHSLFGKGLWFSLILRPRQDPEKAGLFSYLAGVSVAQAVEYYVGIKPEFKWPNDLLIDGKKFCGILSEVNFTNGRINFIILGIGINVNHKSKHFPKELIDRATSLSLETGSLIDRTKLLTKIIYRIEENYYYVQENGFDVITTYWKRRCPRLGKKISIYQDNQHIQGLFEDLDQNGCLLLRTENGDTQKIVAGDLT